MTKFPKQPWRTGRKKGIFKLGRVKSRWWCRVAGCYAAAGVVICGGGEGRQGCLL